LDYKQELERGVPVRKIGSLGPPATAYLVSAPVHDLVAYKPAWINLILGFHKVVVLVSRVVVFILTAPKGSPGHKVGVVHDSIH
jgi:hypothetical protein